MKEATGELNMTVVTVVAIAAVGAFFYAFVWPAIKANINRNTYCAAAYACNDQGNCKAIDEKGNEIDVTCNNKDSGNTYNNNNNKKNG